MSHFAKLNNNIVTEVIVAEQDFINSGAVGDSFLWVQTSYNNNFRKQYAGIGYTYDKVNDVFILPQPFASWTLDASFDWQPPTAKPDDDKMYAWNEDTQAWNETEK
ncbi:MAG: hypothetical protein CL489_07055 [Acidobacteria bacterium]|jgi:hypothetical protein|nr:hypothetical protein [Acidobacteriota bacterium]|tara:strand:- start:247 stop:564 length:318 start_codon:yes stop_codon:yes gene_type:complete